MAELWRNFWQDKYRVGLAVLLLAVFLFHLPGLFYAFPLKNLVGDEVTAMSAIFKMLNDRSLRPDYPSFYHLPVIAYAQLPFYLCLLVFLRLSGLFSSLAELKDFVVLNYGSLLPFTRLLSAIFATGAVGMIYAVARKIFQSRRAALWASFFLGFNFMFFQVSHFGRAWALQILILLAAVYFYLLFFEKKEPRWQDYFWVSFFTALSFGVHLIGAFVYLVFLALFISHYGRQIFNWRAPQFKKFWLLQFSFLLWAGLFYWLNPSGFLIYFQQSGLEKTDAALNWTLGDNLSFYGQIFLTYDWLLAILVLPAIIWFWRRFQPLAIAFLTLIIVWVGSISYMMHSEPRFIVALMPFLILPASGLLDKAGNYLKNAWLRRVFGAAVILATLYLPILWSVKIIQTNTLVLARQWAMSALPPDAKILTNDAYLGLPENQAAAEVMSATKEKWDNLERQMILAKKPEELSQPRFFVLTAGQWVNLENYEMLEPVSFDYLILSFWNPEEQAETYQDFPIEKKLAASFYPTDKVEELTDLANNLLNPFSTLNKIKMSGPYVEIYRLK
jgi:hypothetical protein